MRLSNEIIDQRLSNMGRLIKRLGSYSNSKTKIEWLCLECEYSWYSLTSSVINTGTGCPKCANCIKLTNTDVDQKLIGKNIKRLEDYQNINTPMKWQCITCNFIWKTSSDKIFNAGSKCPQCSRRAPLSNEIVDQRLIGRNIKRVDDYINIGTKIKWQCLINGCNYIWDTTPDIILNDEKGCPKCAGNAPLNNNVVDCRLLGRNIKRLDDYDGINTKIKWQCLDCNCIWPALPGNVLRLERGCPECNIPGTNEKLLHQLLKVSNFQYEPQYSLKKIDNAAPNYKFDAYFPSLKLAIEYNGIQHYEPTGFFGSQHPQEDFEWQQERDQYKRAFCQKNSIQLLEIDGRKLYGHLLKNHILSNLIPFIQTLQGTNNELRAQ